MSGSDRTPVVLGIAGSPRRFGNSDRLLDAALEGARAAGARTVRLVAAEAGMRPCQGCNACSLTGECVLHDEGAAFYRAIGSADAFVVSSPVFFATVPAVLKVLIDRLQPYWARRYVLGSGEVSHRRPAGVLLARSGGDPYGFSAAEATIRSALAVLGADVLDTVVAEGVDSPADLGQQPDVLARARDLGAEVAAEALRRSSRGTDRSSD